MAGIYKRKGRSGWLVDYLDASGRRRRLAAKTREAAETLRDQKSIESRQAAPPVADPDVTLKTYAAGWLKTIAPSLAPKTVARTRTTGPATWSRPSGR